MNPCILLSINWGVVKHCIIELTFMAWYVITANFDLILTDWWKCFVPNTESLVIIFAMHNQRWLSNAQPCFKPDLVNQLFVKPCIYVKASTVLNVGTPLRLHPSYYCFLTPSIRQVCVPNMFVLTLGIFLLISPIYMQHIAKTPNLVWRYSIYKSA